MNADLLAATYAAQQDARLADDRLWNYDATGLDAERVRNDLAAKLAAANFKAAELQAQVGGLVFKVPVDNIAELQERIAKLNKRAVKLNVEPITLVGAGEADRQDVKRNGQKTGEVRVWNWIILNGKAPKLNGWQFVATLEHDGENTLVRTMPSADGVFDLKRFRDASPENCDHCHQNRRRNDTYLVAHENGRINQVGSSCLKDFLGHPNPAEYARFAEYLRDFMDTIEDEREHNGPNVERRYDTAWYLTHVARMIDEFGWVPRSAAGYDQTATADSAFGNMIDMANLNTDRQGRKTYVEPTEDDAETAEAAIAWVRELDEDALVSDYLYNLYTVVKQDTIRNRQMGLAASAISAYSRAMERELKLKAREQKSADSEHVGTVGEKVTGTMTLVKEIRINDYYNGGTKPLYVFDFDGNEVKWFSSRDISGLSQGWTGTVTGTVKKHETHDQYGKSTILTRCKISA